MWDGFAIPFLFAKTDTTKTGADYSMQRVNEILSHPQYQQAMAKLNALEMTRIFCKHGLDHSLNVARIMTIKALEEKYTFSKDLIYATALLHDIGRSLAYENGLDHEGQSGLLASQILPECHFDSDEIHQILTAIVGHNDAALNAPLAKLLKYADKMSRNCFCCNAIAHCYWPEDKKNKGVFI